MARPYNLCPECGQPMLRKGQRRKNADEYRHAQGCPLDRPECMKCGGVIWKTKYAGWKHVRGELRHAVVVAETNNG